MGAVHEVRQISNRSSCDRLRSLPIFPSRRRIRVRRNTSSCRHPRKAISCPSIEEENVKAFIDFTDFDMQRGSLRKAIERAVTQVETKYSPVMFLVRPSHLSEVESVLMHRANSNAMPVTGPPEVLAQIQQGRKRADGPVPNALTDYVFTFNPEVRAAVLDWKAAGWNVYTRWASDLLAFNVPLPDQSESSIGIGIRTRNRKYEVAKHKAKKLRVYAEWRARKPIYEAIETVTKRGGGITLDELKRAVLRLAHKDAAAAGFDLQANHFYAANDSVFRVALNVGVFRTYGGRRIGDQDVAFVVPVVDVDPDFRDRCDLYTLECIINELGDVSDDHCLSLAHLMYGEGKSEVEGGVSLDDLDERFAKLMKLFGERLTRNSSGCYRVASQGSEKVQSIASNS